MCCPEIGSLKGKSIFITRSAHSPAFREKLHSGIRASLQKVLDTTRFFLLSLRFTHSRRPLNGTLRFATKRNGSSPLYILLQKNNPFYRPFSTLPLHFAKGYISGKELHYKGLGHNPRFWLSTSLPLPATLGRNASFPNQNRESSPLLIGKSKPQFS